MTGDRRERRVNAVGYRRNTAARRFIAVYRTDISSSSPSAALSAPACFSAWPGDSNGGPAVLIGYAVAGIIAFLIMRQLGEMVVEEPVSGSFAHFAYKYWGPFAGFLSGWNYWVMFVLVGMAELTAAGIYMQYWLPDVPTWVWAAVFFIIINAVNLVNVRLYGEAEFWFALIKVLAIVGMIGFGPVDAVRRPRRQQGGIR
ncbi:Phenylalanine-specific permease [Raoultella terrigena]|uniref:Phenylalanine-specific permease n=1 Tax=Raoultella terrigena TaxID=577 RepID=A0A4U9D7U7_RAOTE|nr:Phenylalanine-specific permease [Raoultella terrigena]